MAGFDFGKGLRNMFLASVGAVATGAEWSQKVIDDLVKKGVETVEQGKVLNEELSRKAAKAANETQESILRARMEVMTAEERAAYAKKVKDIADDIDAKTTTVEVEVEVPEEEDASGDTDE